MYDLKSIHSEIKSMVPEAGVVKIEHCYINNICGEYWRCQVYRATTIQDNELNEVMFMVGADTCAGLIEEVAKDYAKWTPPNHDAQIARLRAQLAELEGANG